MEKIQKIGATAFILNDNKLLIVRRSQRENFLPGYFEMPGGKIEFGESAEVALSREIKEEANLDVKVIKPYSVFSYTSDDGNRHTIDIQFIVEPTGDIDKIKLSEEHDKFEWITKEEMDNYQFSEQMKEVIIKGFNSI